MHWQIIFLFGEGRKNESVFLGCIINVLFELLHRKIKLYFNLAGTLLIIQDFAEVFLGGVSWLDFFSFLLKNNAYNTQQGY